MGFNTFPCNPYPISTEELNKGNNDDLNTRVTALEGEVSDLNSTKANQITIAPFFSAEASYSVGDLVYYNGLTYRCTNDHEGEWDADDFAATTISNELDSLKSGLTSVGNTVNKIATNGDIWFPAIFSTTPNAGGSYFAALNSLPAHTTATLAAVNELGFGELTLTDFILDAKDEHDLSYIYTTNSAHAGKVCGAKITFT